MLGVDSVTSLLSGVFAPSTGASSTASSGQSASSSSTFGPAFILAGMLAGQSSSVSTDTADSTPSPAEQRRSAALQAAADQLNAGDLRGGRATAEALLKQNAQDVSALALVARSHVLEGNYAQAENFYLRAAAVAPDNTRIQSDLSNTRILQKSDAEAVAVARRKVAASGTRQEGLRLLADLSARSPRNVEIQLALADGFNAAREPLQALEALGQAEAVGGRTDMGGVIERAEAFVEQYPNIGAGHNLLGCALQKAGRIDEALRELETAHRIAPQNSGYGRDLAAAYVIEANTALESGDLTSADANLQRARDITPSAQGYSAANAHLSAALGERDLSAGRFTLAVQHLTEAQSQALEDPDFQQQLARAFVRVAAHYEQEGDKNTARTNYLAAYELDPTSATARDHGAALSHEKGLELRDQGNYATAITHLEKASQLRGDNVTYRHDLAGVYDLNGVTLQALGKLDEAIRNFERGVRLDPSNTDLRSHYAAALAAHTGA
jgi:tetratricopeptide (TPR) repeat protein